MAKKHTKRCSTSLVMGKIKTGPKWDTLRNPREWLKNKDSTKYWQGHRMAGSLIDCCWKGVKQ